jgi:hypothetical protein
MMQDEQVGILQERIRQVIADTEFKLTAQSTLRRWTHMMQEGILKTNDVIRVEVNEDGTVNLLDFTLPSKGGRKRFNIPQEDVEKWIMESISMLRITEEQNLVPELGFKVSDTMYYILNREGEMQHDRT